ncbi:rod shape-determining protein MreD [Bacillus sp. JCM 19046]|uniref:Rod shape-determining protein MreD n=1 Tax=Shouchella xiaoxiensis TaxID=766895 RepID=A0ABS2SSU2_9BACI|nr:rod shape-determining protein MreD [Shouchella xiaoxiensis]MBM7838579.1 rod shape-determining protein MreD [Shouchella xiaoxiensis]GAF13366.1 rod shape-determining protein MreD [Bacillus sp. JCM 19045]GAF19689.1 rod shape-determining protein MreD [Bacillus sp. JCM 19046]
MSRVYFSLVLSLLLVAEGSLLPYIMQNYTDATQFIIPRFSLMVIVLIGLYSGKQVALIYGLAFGLIYDVVYTNYLGIYLFGFAFLGYLFSIPLKVVKESVLWAVLICISSVFLFEYYQYGLFYVLGVTDMSGSVFFTNRLVPTLIFNSAFAIILVLPFRKLAQHVNEQASFRDR